MRILGVDPGFGITGYGMVEVTTGKPRLIEAGEIRTKASLPLEKRLLELFKGLGDVADELKPDVLSVEDLYSHYSHPKTAVIMGHARGVIFLSAAEKGIPVFSYSATRIKKSITGNGRATKEQISRMVSGLLGIEEVLSRPDVTDALAAALCHVNSILHGGAH